MIHCLGSAYGWDKKTILEQIYPEEIEPLMNRVRRDEVNSNLTHLAIVHNPKTKDPKRLVAQFENQLRKLDGRYFSVEDMDDANANKLLKIKEQMKDNAKKRKR